MSGTSGSRQGDIGRRNTSGGATAGRRGAQRTGRRQTANR